MKDAKADTETKKPSLLRRAGRALLQTGITLGVAAGAVFAVQTGMAVLNQRAEAAAPPDAASIMPVSAAPIVLEDSYEVTRSLVGQIEPQRSIAVSFELSGQLEQIDVDEGDSVREGQELARLDTRLLDASQKRLSAQQSALEAQLRFAEQTLERQSELSDRGFASQSALDEAASRTDEFRARIAEIEAALLTNDIQIEKSTLAAPFAGTVTERRVDGGESLSPGQAILEIVQDRAPQVRIGVPLDLKAEAIANAQINVGGTIYDADLLTLRPDVDPVTRTRTAIFSVETDKTLTFGQTARLQLTDAIKAKGTRVQMTTLKEGVRGQWTLLGVDKAQTVRAISVQVQHIEGDRAFVSGAFPDGTLLITEGPQRVTVGQKVIPQQGLTLTEATD